MNKQDAREPLWACSTESVVQIFHRGQRVAAHPRSREAYKHTTDPAHMRRRIGGTPLASTACSRGLRRSEQ